MVKDTCSDGVEADMGVPLTIWFFPVGIVSQNFGLPFFSLVLLV
jgi:hypothetical protein